MTMDASSLSVVFPAASAPLERYGLKFTAGGSHISRTMMLSELDTILSNVPRGAPVSEYREAVVSRNVLGKTTVSTRLKSLRHLRELYALDEAVPLFAALRLLHEIDSNSLPLLALLVAWSRDPLLRATSPPIMDARPGVRVEVADLAKAVSLVFADQYSPLNRAKIARNAASTWTQSGHLTGRTKKVRQQVWPTITAATMSFFLGQIAGYYGAAVFTNPWTQLLDLGGERGRGMAVEAHRAGLLNFRAVGEVIEMNFPMFASFEQQT